MKTGIALGSNLGDRRAQIAVGRDFVLSLHEGVEAPLCSGLYETEPVDCAPGTAAFFNAVVEIETSLAPLDLLQKLRDYEQASGRNERRAKNSPREIDLDLLYADNLRLASPALVLPHPRMTSRRFVLQPLSDICADLVLPGQSASIAQLLSALPPEPAVRLVARDW
ncbi:MAG: 2-amino-4-hydroxy-6-hydroxymethyldihydropteridine diphosphokinase [Chthoniobacterales bacterium]